MYRLLALWALTACESAPGQMGNQADTGAAPVAGLNADSSSHTIHVFVALCDNTYQGIVKVPTRIGNGQDPANNLYWGCGYGIKTYFSRSAEWRLLATRPGHDQVLERLVFQHIRTGHFIVADAYDGRFIRDCTHDFLQATAGLVKDTVQLPDTIIGCAGAAGITAYVGHNGLMDFTLPMDYRNRDNSVRRCIILACISQTYFEPYLKQAEAQPLLWTTGLMAPEAYTLHDALTGYVLGEEGAAIRTRAAQAYHRYQGCGERAALNLLVTGW